ATHGAWNISVPGVLTTQALVRVSPAGRPGEGDTSDVPFTLVAPTLTVTAPQANESWQIGTTRQIRWNGNLGRLSDFAFTVEVSSDGGVTWRGTGSNVNRLHWDQYSGFSKDWYVTGPVTTHGRVRVRWSGGGMSASDESDDRKSVV